MFSNDYTIAEEITRINRDVESDKRVSDNHKRDAFINRYIPLSAMLLGDLALSFYFRKENIKEIPDDESKQVEINPFDF